MRLEDLYSVFTFLILNVFLMSGRFLRQVEENWKRTGFNELIHLQCYIMAKNNSRNTVYMNEICCTYIHSRNTCSRG